MKNYQVIKDGFETIIQSEALQTNNETGQTFFWSKGKDRVTAILPKECIIIETGDYTPLQRIVAELKSEFSAGCHFNDVERELPEFMDLKFWKERYSLMMHDKFAKLLEEISNP